MRTLATALWDTSEDVMKRLDIQLHILTEDPCQTIESAQNLCDAAQGMLIPVK